MIRQNDVDFMDLNNGFIVKEAKKNYTPLGLLYKQKRPIADIVRAILNNADIFKLSDNYRTIGFYWFIVGMKIDCIMSIGYTEGQAKSTIRALWKKAERLNEKNIKPSELKRYIEEERKNAKVKMIKNTVSKMKKVKCNRFNLFNENIVLFKLRKANQKIK